MLQTPSPNELDSALDTPEKKEAKKARLKRLREVREAMFEELMPSSKKFRPQHESRGSGLSETVLSDITASSFLSDNSGRLEERIAVVADKPSPPKSTSAVEEEEEDERVPGTSCSTTTRTTTTAISAGRRQTARVPQPSRKYTTSE
jgi:hypothetical protein